MLDMIGISFSSVMILMVVIRAIQRDRDQPWFENIKVKAPSTKAECSAKPWHRQALPNSRTP